MTNKKNKITLDLTELLTQYFHKKIETHVRESGCSQI